MSASNKNQLKFNVGKNTSNLFKEETASKLMQLGFTIAGNDNGDIVLFYQHGDEIPFEVANHAKVLMEKHIPASGEEVKSYHPIPFVPPNIKEGEEVAARIEKFEEIIDKAQSDAEQDQKELEEHEEHNDEE